MINEDTTAGVNEEEDDEDIMPIRPRKKPALIHQEEDDEDEDDEDESADDDEDDDDPTPVRRSKKMAKRAMPVSHTVTLSPHIARQDGRAIRLTLFHKKTLYNTLRLWKNNYNNVYALLYTPAPTNLSEEPGAIEVLVPSYSDLRGAANAVQLYELDTYLAEALVELGILQKDKVEEAYLRGKWLKAFANRATYLFTSAMDLEEDLEKPELVDRIKRLASARADKEVKGGHPSEAEFNEYLIRKAKEWNGQ